jgi:uncharacterized protein YyaL (SSP411 family)
MPNRLANETSPYLLQHAGNPVEWYAWGAAALERAAAEDKPILLSIGYAACHWCHVMAHESFEDAGTARLMNDWFVNIKVDREERPDLDSIYMQAVQAMTGQGGWPMTVFLTPAGEPFYGGTYFPPEDRHGMPSFRRVLESVHEAWVGRREEVMRSVASVGEVYVAAAAPARAGASLDNESLDRAIRDLSARFEPMAGGFGGAPKFPMTMALDFLLRQWARSGNERALHIVEHSFRQMSRGGIYDQVGGGFHRYTVDARWIVPHFEKMLYDNGLLARLGIHLWQARGEPEVRRIAEETLRWVMREMTDASGGWYSSLDADSEHEEGKFYVWSTAELKQLLGADAVPAMAYFGASEQGNFEGLNILTAEGADKPNGALGDSDVLIRVKQLLYTVRSKRIWPARDEKILASWNGLMLRAMAEGARVFDDAAMRSAAIANGEFLVREMVRDGRVFRTHTKGETRIPGFLEDHAAVGLGFLALYQLTLERVWFDRAAELADSCVTHFWDDGLGAFFDTANDHEKLVTRPRDLMDNAVPSGNSMAVELLLIVADLTGDSAMRTRASFVLDSLSEPMTRYPTMFGHALGAADIAVNGAIEVAIAGDPGANDFSAFTSEVARHYLPSLVMAGGAGDAVRGLALMDGRAAIDGSATGYVCQNSVCDLPTTDVAAFAGQLTRAVGGLRH